MLSSRFAFVALGVACVAAAGAGGYFALRQNAAPAGTVALSTVPPVPVAVSDRPVQGTEPVVGNAPPARDEAPAPLAKAAPPRRASSKANAQATSIGSSAQPFPPAGSTPAPAPVAPPAPEPVVPPARPDVVERTAQDPPPPVEPPRAPQRSFDELVVSTDSVIGLQSETTVTSEQARVEDRVEARVTRDVKVGDRVAIPAGSRAIGFVTQVERGGKLKEQARLNIRFQTIVLPDGTRLPISTAAIERVGEGKGNASTAKIGGAAVAGTILGAILGGGKGAAIGGLAGAGAGSAAVAAGDRSTAALRAGEAFTIRLLSPVTVTSDR